MGLGGSDCASAAVHVRARAGTRRSAYTYSTRRALLGLKQVRSRYLDVTCPALLEHSKHSLEGRQVCWSTLEPYGFLCCIELVVLTTGDGHIP